jgi:endo-1,4-beta-xylanase
MGDSRIPRLLIAIVLLAGVVPGMASATPSGAQQAAQTGLLGFAAAHPPISEQLSLVEDYGFSWMTPENALKMETIGGCDGEFDFGPTDELLALANGLGMKMHGHVLIWHKQTSPCATSYTRDEMRAYIETVTGRYCGKIPSIDVVNEALGRSGGFRSERESVWRRLFGDSDYIISAFKWARAACPEMKLYYNDYGIEYGSKSEEMLELVRVLDKRGIIDGVGFQSHMLMGSIDIPAFGATMDAVIDMGLEVAVSELDIRWDRDYRELTAEDFEEQAMAYRQVAELCAARPACVRFSVWGLDDGTSWVNDWWEFGFFEDAALLFDRNLHPKPAYCHGVRPVFDLPWGACAVG